MAQPITNLLINGLNPVTIGGTGTAVKVFPYVPGASIGAVSAKNGVLFVPGNGEANAQRLSIRATGNVTVSGDLTSPAITIGLYPVTFSGALGNLTGVVGTTALASAAFTAANDANSISPWAISVDLEADGIAAQLPNSPVPPQVGGSGLGQVLSAAIVMDGVNGTISPAAPSLFTGAAGAALNMNAPIPFGLAVGITFSISSSGNSASMFQFDLSL